MRSVSVHGPVPVTLGHPTLVTQVIRLLDLVLSPHIECGSAVDVSIVIDPRVRLL
jgi:hypothetical protein